MEALLNLAEAQLNLTEADFAERFPLICDEAGDVIRFDSPEEEPEKAFLSSLDERYLWSQHEVAKGVVYAPFRRLGEGECHFVSTQPWEYADREAGLQYKIVLYDECGDLLPEA